METIIDKFRLTTYVNGGNEDNYNHDVLIQNRWNDKCAVRHAIISVGEPMSNFVKKYNPELMELRLHRNEKHHGISGPVKPDLSNLPNMETKGARRGEWTDYMELDVSIFRQPFNILLGSCKTGSEYAIWDKVEIRITYDNEEVSNVIF